MKTVRFAEVVRTSGTPEVHLLLSDPSHDPILRKAVESNRVMTLHQPPVGNRADFGTVGFVEGVTGQVLIFPKTLRGFDGRNVVGIKYDLLTPETSGSRTGRSKTRRSKAARVLPKTEVAKKIVPFPARRGNQDVKGRKEQNDVDEIKKRVRRALKALADGKQVVAYRLLETILEP